MIIFVLSTALALTAHAQSSEPCEDLFINPAYAAAPPAFARYADAARRLTRVHQRGVDRFDGVRFHLVRAKLWWAARGFVNDLGTTADRSAACAAVVALNRETQLVQSDARLVRRLVSKLCDGEAIMAVSEVALGVVDRFGTNQYSDLLGFTNHGHDQRARGQARSWFVKAIAKGWLDHDRVRTLITDRDPLHLLPIADALDGDFAKVGFDGPARLELAHRFARVTQSYPALTRLVRLEPPQSAELIEHLNVLQWLSWAHLNGRLNDAALPELRERAARATLLSTHDTWASQKFVTELLYDTALPLATWEEIRDVLAEAWPKLYGGWAKLEPHFVGGPHLNRAQLARAEAVFGREEVRPKQVWRESRREAKALLAPLGTAKFASAEEFVTAFTVATHYAVDGRYSPRMRAVAEVYFKTLRRRLPDFFALNPTAAQARWILETPLRFPYGLHNEDLHWGRGRYNPRRLLPTRTGRYDVRRHIFALQDEALAAAMRNVRTVEDWQTLVTFRTHGASEYHDQKLWAMSRYLDVAARVGDGALGWLDLVVEKNAHELRSIATQHRLSWTTQLLRLRDAVPAERRTAEAIANRAVELLTTPELERTTSDVVGEHPLLRVYTTPDLEGGEPDPKVVRAYVTHLREGLLRFLAARGEAGARVRLDETALARLRAVAEPLGYRVDDLGEHDVKIVPLKRP